MSPGLTTARGADISSIAVQNATRRSASSYLLNRNLRVDPIKMIGQDGIYSYLADGRKILDGSGGAGVLNVGSKQESVRAALFAQFSTGVMYASAMDYYTDPAAELARLLVESTNGDLRRAVFYGSGKSVLFFFACIRTYQP